MDGGGTSSTDTSTPLGMSSSRGGFRRRGRGRRGGAGGCGSSITQDCGPNPVNEDGSLSSSHRRGNHHRTRPGSGLRYGDDDSSQANRRSRPGEENNPASFLGSDRRETEGGGHQRQLTHPDRQRGNRGFFTHRVRGNSSSQPTRHTFNPSASPFVPQSLMNRVQPVSVLSNQQSTRGQLRPSYHRGCGVYRNQEENRISGMKRVVYILSNSEKTISVTPEESEK
ncbi:hypothetical protein KIN20_006621 [Parelaphostrongylus tenuis]|uniref:Uncharacterized protein n=1 Tax=Parelaphostrongylus tenuis TaxID=148309 RepID=A0AAD5MMU4_PARTN|nr:hypothetical protein KIN20_006621 [Parelaphostrongylus tenuis]